MVSFLRVYPGSPNLQLPTMLWKGLSLAILLLLISASSCYADNSDAGCGYESCNAEKPGMINVHLVPHTHDDVGWLMTVDQYYYKYVQWILDGVIPELVADPSKRFIYVEIAFFSRWFRQQDKATQQVVKKLVNEGRLEFILGGWSMNDEAATHYSAIIDNHKLGFEFLRENFGKCGRTKIGWQIDPFGHSREQASLFAQFGFDGLFFGRLDYQDKDKRQKTKTMEHVWRGSPKNLGAKANLFTGVLPNGYNPPNGFCFDYTCLAYNPSQTEIMDDPRLHDYNVELMVDGLIKAMKDQSRSYATNHLIATMGSDFNYVQAHMFFAEMDKLIKYVNARQAVGSKINLLYSTPSCYLKQLNNDNRTWTTKDDDFFPYADRAHGFWSGYFTSRPTQKHYTRVVNSFFQSTKQMYCLAKLNGLNKSKEQLNILASALGTAQHHDAITGTEKQAVVFDYEERLANGVNQVQNVVQDVYNKLMPKGGAAAPEQLFCTQLNISLCSVTANLTNLQVTLYNPLAREAKYYVRLPVSGTKYTVYQSDGKTTVQNDVLPISPGTAQIPLPTNRTAHFEVVFLASVPALGFSTYFVRRQSTSNVLRFQREYYRTQVSTDNSIKGKYVRLDFSASGEVSSMTNLKTGLKVPLSQNFFYYEGMTGNNTKGEFQASGAYIFRPQKNEPTKLSLKFFAGIQRGVLVQEAYQQVTNWVSQVYRIYEDKPYVEVEWTVGPVPVADHIGKEVITRYHLDGFENKKTFYTDANGREILERVLNYRPTWQLKQTEPVAGNYYPVNSFISIKDTKKNVQFTVLVDRAQGGTSLNEGDVELMLHRRLLVDDGKGVGEALDERDIDGKGLVTRGTHYLLLDSIENSSRLYRPTAQDIFLTPAISFSTAEVSPVQYVTKFKTQWSALKSSLPANIHLLTLEQFYQSGPLPTASGEVPYLVRFEHFYEVGEDKEYSKPVSFDLKNVFSPFVISEIQELSLGGNIPIDEVKRLQWRTSNTSDSKSEQPTKHLTGTTLTLSPMEIVTLQVNVRV
ncbi:lysosomal alpha-mannosidase [Aplysia californica]|uniref:Alpha-mannosidase n=1 Tax=Aplysia californica TaxID=6500 RepID=A0ABM0JK20_APLCA|nr:lysosomal alpha-mannosidase [Aplysia californica]